MAPSALRISRMATGSNWREDGVLVGAGERQAVLKAVVGERCVGVGQIEQRHLAAAERHREAVASRVAQAVDAHAVGHREHGVDADRIRAP